MTLEGLATSLGSSAPRYGRSLATAAFRRDGAQLSCKPRGEVERPSIDKPIHDLIQTMARANSLWRAPRIHGELLKIGIKIFERTGSRLLRTVKRAPAQSWK